MKILGVQSVNFLGKKITPNMQKNTQSLLSKMNQLTEFNENPAKTKWTTKILCRIDLNPKTQFIDERYLIRPIKESTAQSGQCSLRIGKTELTIDANSGEIIKYKKPFFKTWKSVFKQASNALEQMVNEFNNNDIISKYYLSSLGFTEKGLRKFSSSNKKV